MTKEEMAEYQRRYWAENRDRLNANARYRFHHNEEVREKNRVKARKYYQDHKHDPEFMAKRYASIAKYRRKKKGKTDERS